MMETIKQEIMDSDEVIIENVDSAKKEPKEETADECSSNGEIQKFMEKYPLKIIPLGNGVGQLEVENLQPNPGAADEEEVEMSREELFWFMEKTMVQNVSNPDVNPLLKARNEREKLEAQMSELEMAFSNLERKQKLLYNDQMKFLRKVNVLPKPTEHKAVQNSRPPLLTDFKGYTPKTESISSLAAVKPQITLSGKKSSIEFIDLTDEADVKEAQASLHPAPLPPAPYYPIDSSIADVPPKPSLRERETTVEGICIEWSIPSLAKRHTAIKKYEIWGYNEQRNEPVTSALWQKIGEVAAQGLPMACTLTQFQHGNRYHFTVRAVDRHNRMTEFAKPIFKNYRK